MPRMIDLALWFLMRSIVCFSIRGAQIDLEIYQLLWLSAKKLWEMFEWSTCGHPGFSGTRCCLPGGLKLGCSTKEENNGQPDKNFELIYVIPPLTNRFPKIFAVLPEKENEAWGISRNHGGDHPVGWMGWRDSTLLPQGKAWTSVHGNRKAIYSEVP